MFHTHYASYLSMQLLLGQSMQVDCCDLYFCEILYMQTTTTLNGLCTDDFDGTSAATPLVSGVMALALQAK